MTKKREVIDAESTIVNARSEILFERVSDYLTSHDWSFKAMLNKVHEIRS